jgi:two-component system, OmpR family, sensor kinase
VFRSLRAKLIASFAVVVVLALLLAGTGFAYLIRNSQADVQVNRLADVVIPLAFQIRLQERAGATPDQIRKSIQDVASDLGDSNARIFLIDSNRKVVFDSEDNLVGQVLPAPAAERQRLGIPVGRGQFQIPGQPAMAFVVVDARPFRLEGRAPPPQAPGPSVTDYGVVVAVPERQLAAAWVQLAPDLLFAGLVALVVSIVVAFVLARSISRPLAQVTRASERMAQGDFDQYIDVKSRDEVGHLAASFNAMAREVGRMNRTMRDLLANVSHELKTPLTSIEGFSQAMVDGTIRTPEQFQDAGRIIGEEAERMHRLVEDLLYLSKIESGQIDIARTKLSLPDLLQTCVRQIQFQAENAGLSVRVETAPVPEVVADSHRLQQVFVNLLDNAVKHTPPTGSVEVKAYSVATRIGRNGHDGAAGPTSGAWVAVDVHNSGSYIPPDQAERIFERFYQIDRSRAGKGDGSGLGLAIAREIVQAHQGRVEVKSDPARGTTFTVYLPAAA